MTVRLRLKTRANVVALVIAVFATLLVVIQSAAPALAHCPGTFLPGGAGDRRVSAGQQILTASAAKGIRATIEWTNPNVCSNPGGSAFSLEVVNICSNNTCTGGRVQVGWRKQQVHSSPRFYCEFHTAGGGNTILYAPLSAATHDFKVQYDPFDAGWDCYLDGVGKFFRTTGFSSGTLLIVQGEVNTTHAQIGRNAPSKLSISDMQYQRVSDGQWPVFNVNTNTVHSPYGGDEPAVGQWRNWTNAH